MKSKKSGQKPSNKKQGDKKKATQEKAARQTVPGGLGNLADSIPQLGRDEDDNGSEGDRDDAGEADVKQTDTGAGDDVAVAEANHVDAGVAEANHIDANTAEANDVDMGDWNIVGRREASDAGSGNGDDAGEGEGNDAGAGEGEGNTGMGNGNDVRAGQGDASVGNNDASAGNNDATASAESHAGASEGEGNPAVVSHGNDTGVNKNLPAWGEDNAGVGKSDDASPGEGNDPGDSEAKDSSTNTTSKPKPPHAGEASAVEVEGLKEMIQLIEAWGEQREVDPGLVDKLRGTPLSPVYEALDESWKKMLARMSETESRRVPPPYSPPPTPQETSRISTRDTQDQPQQTARSPPKLSDNQQSQTEQPQPPQTSRAPGVHTNQRPQVESTSHPPPKSYVEQQTQTEQPTYLSSDVQTDKQLQAELPQSQQTSHSPNMHTNKQPRAGKPQPASSTQPTQVVAPWDGKELKTLEASIKALSSKLDSMSKMMSTMASKQDITGSLGALSNELGKVVSQTAQEIKTSGGLTKSRVDKVDTTVSQISTKLDASVSTLQQSIKQLQDTVAKKPASVTQNPRPELRSDPKTSELEAQVEQLQQVLDRTRVELLQADIAFKVAIEGNFSEEVEAAGASGEAPSKPDSGRDPIQIAQGIRIRTLRLISRCRALFNFISGKSSSSSLESAIMVGEWAKCVERLQAREHKVRKAIKEKEEATRELQFHRFLVDQIRRGFYTPSEWKLALDGRDFATFMEQSYDSFANIQLLAQDMYRLQHSRPRKPLSSSKPKFEESRSAPLPGWAPLFV